MVPLGLRPVPALERAREMEQRLASLPSRHRARRRFFDGQSIGETAMMMHVIDQRHFRRLADRQQIERRVNLVVIFQCEAQAHLRRQPLNVSPQRAQRCGLVAISAAAVNVYGVRPDPFGDLRLIVQLGQRVSERLVIRRIQHHELVRVKGEAHIALSGKRAALTKAPDDFRTAGQLRHFVTRLRMRLAWKNMAVDAERADLIRRAELQRCHQRLGVVSANLRESGQSLGGRQAQHGRRGRGAKFDWLVRELAAQAESQPGVLRRVHAFSNHFADKVRSRK